jgi:hypothetical protein
MLVEQYYRQECVITTDITNITDLRRLYYHYVTLTLNSDIDITLETFSEKIRMLANQDRIRNGWPYCGILMRSDVVDDLSAQMGTMTLVE